MSHSTTPTVASTPSAPNSDTTPKITFTNQSSTAPRETVVLFVPLVEGEYLLDHRFLAQVETLACRNFEHIYLNVSNTHPVREWHVANEIDGRSREVRGGTVYTNYTWTTKEDLPLLLQGKGAFIVQKEYRSMFSTAYVNVIKAMYQRVGLTYFESHIENSDVLDHVRQQIKEDTVLGPLCTRSKGHLAIESGGFVMDIQSNGMMNAIVLD